MAANPSIQLGTDGNWAIKEDNLLAYKKDGTRFFNKEFDFTRNTTATFVDKDGLIKESATNTPRIDFIDDTTGHLLLEPQSTNLITYSEDFANAAWSKRGNTVVTSNTVISPNGTLNGSTVSGLSGTGSNDLQFVKSGNTANNTYTYSVYLKGSGTLRIQLSNGIDQGFDDTITLTSSWKRHFLTSTFNSTTTPSLIANLDDLNGQTATQFDIWGAQLEQNSYATSYIPTSGSAVTRNQEICNNSGTVNDFNSEEGVLYAEIAALSDDLTFRTITLSDGTISNNVGFGYRNNSNVIYTFLQGVINSSSAVTVSNITDFNKVAIKYKSGDYAMWINGVEVYTSTTSFTLNGLSEVSFDNGSGAADFYGSCKTVAVFKRALTDAELQELTT